MTPFKLLSAASIAAVMLATPAMARRSCLANVHVPKIANETGSPTTRYSGGRVRIIAPRIGAHVTAPANAPGGVCDFGDNPMIC
jgi:hypothetical protein